MQDEDVEGKRAASPKKPDIRLEIWLRCASFIRGIFCVTLEERPSQPIQVTAHFFLLLWGKRWCLILQTQTPNRQMRVALNVMCHKHPDT